MGNTKKGEKPTRVRDVSTSAIEALMQGGDPQVIFELLISNARLLAATGQGQQLIKMAPYMGDESESGLAIRRGFVMLGHLVDLNFEIAEALANQLYIEEKNCPVFDFIEKITNYAFAVTSFARGDLNSTLNHIDGALNAPLITSDLGDADKINLIRLRCGVLMLQSDEPEIQRQLDKATKITDESKEGDFGIHLMAIKALLFHEQGEFLKAAEMAKAVITSSEVYGYTGITSAMDCKFILARCYLAFGKLEESIELLQELKIEAEKSKIYTWYVSAEVNIIRLLSELTRIHEAHDHVIRLRTYIAKFPIKYDLDWMVDVAELYVRYRLNDWTRAKELAERAPKTYYISQIIQDMESSKGKKISKEVVLQYSEDTPRNKLWKYLRLSEFPATKDFSPLESMKTAIEIGEKTGARDVFIRQSDNHYNLIFQLGREEPSNFLEELSRDCLKRVNLRNHSQTNSQVALTSRELQVLKHLATGKAINQIGKELHISQNTMKTHLRNIYHKMQVDGRKSAVIKAQENFLI